MVQDILKALQQVTVERDVDSLEMTLTATLMQHFSCSQVRLFEVVDTFVDQTLCMTYDSNGGYLLNAERITIEDADLSGKLQVAEHPIIFPTDGQIQQVIVPLVIDSSTVGAIELISDQDFSSHAVELGIFVEIYRNYLAILRESERDKLTQLFNRKTFEKKLSRLIAEQQNYSDSNAKEGQTRQYNPNDRVWLAILDVDHFKQVNDQYGHVCGDEVLLVLANLMRQSFRREDLLFRFGGEEFIVVLAPTSAERVHQILDRFRLLVEQTSFPLVGRISVSIGYEALSSEEYPMQVVERADKALYFVKENGRNSIAAYQTLIANGKISHVKTNAESDIDLF